MKKPIPTSLGNLRGGKVSAAFLRAVRIPTSIIHPSSDFIKRFFARDTSVLCILNGSWP